MTDSEHLKAHAMNAYGEAFYEYVEATSGPSAQVVVPLIMELVKPRRVIDVGCGLGAWLKVFQEHGVADIRGVDGPWTVGRPLLIPRDKLTIADLSKPLALSERYDLVVSLEVAEHLSPNCAKAFVETLTGLGHVVMFSAAVPYQGGTDHLNEQWQDYWAGLFAEHGYVPIDYVRRKVWSDERVSWWYAQNMLLFAAENVLEANPALRQEACTTGVPMMSVIHPRQYEYTLKRLRDPKAVLTHISLRRLLAALPAAMARAIVSRFGKVAHHDRNGK